MQLLACFDVILIILALMMLSNIPHFHKEDLLAINASEALAMICYESTTDGAATQDLDIGMIKNEILNTIEVLPDFCNRIVSDKICGIVIIEDYSLGMTQNELLNDNEVLPDLHSKSILDVTRSVSVIIAMDFGIGITKNELIDNHGTFTVAESRHLSFWGQRCWQRSSEFLAG